MAIKHHRNRRKISWSSKKNENYENDIRDETNLD